MKKTKLQFATKTYTCKNVIGCSYYEIPPCDDSRQSCKKVWGVPKQQGKIRGTLLEDDILDLEGGMHLYLIFVSHKPTPMHKDYFWNIVHPKTNVVSTYDRDKTTIPHIEQERDLICRIIRGEVNDANQDADHDNHDKDDVSKVSNDESICNNNSEENFIQGVNDEDFDGDVTSE
jgi:hypothetical protein